MHLMRLGAWKTYGGLKSVCIMWKIWWKKKHVRGGGEEKEEGGCEFCNGRLECRGGSLCFPIPTGS
jgi:hypothetical protein